MASVSENYTKALRRGEKSYREHLNKGEYPYLQVLEELLNHVSVVGEQKLGIQEIPIEAIHGTFAAGRRTAFAPNFMPLLSGNSEFAMKWDKLCTAHLNEGIKDAIICYEYMNRYYVLEGNKRVSVLKFYNAATVTANVTRIVPRKNDSKESIVYHEYLAFYTKCPVNYLVFTEIGSYDAFLELAKDDVSEMWSEEELLDLRSAFVRFKEAFLKMGGASVEGLTVSDAYLTYLSIYGYKETINKIPDEVYMDLEKIWDEIVLHSDTEDNVQFLLEASEGKQKGLITQILDSFTDKRLNVCFIYHDDPEKSDWAYGHELGRTHLEDVFQERIHTFYYKNIDEETIDEAIQSAIEEGADIIFATSRLFMKACLRAAVENPKVKILNCSLNASHRYIRTYYARIFEAKFLSGIIAGCISTNNEIGYLADTPVPSNITNLNAFALGVKIVNPYAHVHAIWKNEIGTDAKGYFWDHGINLISGREMVSPSSLNREFGLYQIDNGVITSLAMSLYNWGILYEKLIDSMEDGTFKEEDKLSEGRALNYWWGMPSDVIDLIVSDHVPAETRSLISFLRDNIRSGLLVPFSGIIHAKDRVISDDPNYRLTPEEIMHMDWLLDNIVGHIPSIEELNEEGKKHMLSYVKKEEF